MSIASEISRLQGVSADIATAIIDKGVQVPSGAAFADYPDLIRAISGGVGPISFEMKPILPVEGNKTIICDENGNIGYSGPPSYLFPAYTSYAVVAHGVDLSGSGQGSVTVLEPDTTVIGGRIYRTVTIDGVTWLAENLDYKASGIEIGPARYPSVPAAWYYDNDEATYGVDGNKYGLLYNGYAAHYLNDNRATLTPGWHVPSVDEWTALLDSAGGSSIAGTKLKAVSGWSSGGGTDDYGFSAFPGGLKQQGAFLYVGARGTFWTSTYGTTQTVTSFRGFTSSAEVVSLSSNNREYGYSIRLVQDR